MIACIKDGKPITQENVVGIVYLSTGSEKSLSGEKTLATFKGSGSAMDPADGKVFTVYVEMVEIV